MNTAAVCDSSLIITD